MLSKANLQKINLNGCSFYPNKFYFCPKYEYAMKKILFLSILLLQYWTLIADNYYCKTIGIANGLSQSSVTDVTYDGNGTLWVGTKFGLNEFRNGKLRTFLDDKSGKIKGNHVNLLYCDTRKNLWASTDKGLFQYDLSSDSFVLFDELPVFCATESGDTLYLGGHNGMCTYSYSDGRFCAGTSESYTDYVMLDIYDGSLLTIDRKAGIKLTGHGTSTLLPIDEAEDNQIIKGVRSGNVLYLSVMNVGLVEYDLKERKTRRVVRSGQNGLPSEIMLSLLIYENFLWMGFDGAGLWIMNRDNGEVKSVEDIYEFPSKDDLPSSITALYHDQFDNIWVGSVRSGLLGLKMSPIKLLSESGRRRDPMEKNVVISLLPSSDGRLYIGTDGDGVKYTNTLETNIKEYPGQKGLKVTSIADFDNERIIVCIYNSGFYLMDRKSGRLSPFTLVDKKTNAAECLNSNAPKLYNLDNGHILFLAVNTYLYDKSTGTFSVFSDESHEQGKELVAIGNNTTNSLYAYSSVGLFRIGVHNRTISQIYAADTETGSINTAVIHNDIIYFGTNYGLFQYDLKKNSVSEIESVMFTRVSALHYSAGGNLWVGADNTLFLYRNGAFTYVGENRGVPANEFLVSASGSNESVYLGGTSGLIGIGGNYVFDTSESKQVVLHDVSVKGKRISMPDGVLKLKHDFSSLTLSANLIGADPFDIIRYRYTVAGNNGFNYTAYKDNLEIPELKHGSYTVQASYLMSDGLWSQPKDVLELTVSPPWYLSLPMVLLYVLVCLAVFFYLIDRISRKRLAEMEAELKSRDLIFSNALKTYINDNISNPELNVADIAANMAMSRASLYYRVNATFGKGVAELIEERRMEMAEELLQTSVMSVLEISEKVGYSTPRYFCTRFKQRHNGVTPLKYRQKNNK